MSFLTSVRRALPAATLFVTFASAQTCFFPDGKTVSSDIPCNNTAGASACCSSQSFCLAGGLCFAGGVLTRGSCTDSTWGSEDCAGYCQTINTDAEVAITPCDTGASTNTFVCGLSNSKCQDSSKTFSLPSDLGLVLRPAQIAALVGPALAAASAQGSGGYTGGQVAGVACGLTLPLLLALGVVGFFLAKERRRFGNRKSMLKLPDDSKEAYFSYQSPTPVQETLQHTASDASAASSRSAGSNRGSLRTMATEGSPNTTLISPITSPRASRAGFNEPQRSHSYAESRISRISGPSRVSRKSRMSRLSHVPSFAEVIETTRVTPQIVDVASVGGSSLSRHELDSSPVTPKEVERFELATNRMSR